MPALSAVLHALSFVFSLRLFLVGSHHAAAAAAVYVVTQYRTSDVDENVGSTFLVCGVQRRGKTLN